MDLADPLGESRVDPLPLGGWPNSPAIVATAGDAQHAAHQRDREARPLRLNESKTTHRIPSSLAKKAAVDSTGRCNTVGLPALFGSEVWVWLIWVVRDCRRCARRSCGMGGRPESPLATSLGLWRSLPALFTGYSKPLAGSLHPSDAGRGGRSAWLSGRRSPGDLRPESRCAL